MQTPLPLNGYTHTHTHTEGEAAGDLCVTPPPNTHTLVHRVTGKDHWGLVCTHPYRSQVHTQGEVIGALCADPPKLTGMCSHRDSWGNTG